MNTPQQRENKPLTEKQRSVFATNAKFKLVMFFRKGIGRNGDNKPKVFFSRELHDKAGDAGEKALIDLVTEKYTGKYRTALIYDNQTGVLLHKWVFNGILEDKRI
ncbi:MAG: hypothetical protein F9K23_11670 [Bacteroidetes bacterium]|nr:MAG: hypothetical protein F9K23_11670 [Bacteroidota bacterium]